MIKTKQTPLSVKIAKRRPTKTALRKALRPSDKPRGRPKTTYLQVTKTQLKEKHFQTLEDAMMEAKTEKGGEQSSRTQAF